MNMMGMKRITIAQYERGLLFRNRSFEAVMEPGVYWLFDPLSRTEIKVYDVAVAEFEHPRVDVLITEARALIERYLMIVELGDREVGLVYKNDRLVSVLPPGKRQLYWRGPDRGSGSGEGHLARHHAGCRHGSNPHARRRTGNERRGHWFGRGAGHVGGSADRGR